MDEGAVCQGNKPSYRSVIAVSLGWSSSCTALLAPPPHPLCSPPSYRKLVVNMSIKVRLLYVASSSTSIWCLDIKVLWKSVYFSRFPFWRLRFSPPLLARQRAGPIFHAENERPKCLQGIQCNNVDDVIAHRVLMTRAHSSALHCHLGRKPSS